MIRITLFAITILLTGCMAANNGNGGGGGNNNQGPGEVAEDYFATAVKPAFLNRCQGCHPTVFTFKMASSAIYDKSAMKVHLGNGGVDSNALIQYAQGFSSGHPAIDHCNGNLSSSPCLEIRNWFAKEFPDAPQSSIPVGNVDSIDVMGTMKGYAVIPSKGSDFLQVRIYRDGNENVGTLIGTVTANGTFGPYGAKHGFTFQLPDAVRDGNSHSIYAYAVDLEGDTFVLGNSPTTIRLRMPRTAGTNFFNANVLPKFQAKCIQCHGAGASMYSDSAMFYAVGASTTPYFNATSTNNFIYNKASGNNHGGGNQCSGANNPCPDLVTWFINHFN